MGTPSALLTPITPEQLHHRDAAEHGGGGCHVLSLAFNGVIRDDVRGLVPAALSTLPDGTRSQIISSAFEPTDARLMFPCWDEPAFRARFRITMTVPAQWAAISNMPVQTSGARSHGHCEL